MPKRKTYSKSKKGYKRAYKRNKRVLTNYKNVEMALRTSRSLYAAPYPPVFETTNSYMGVINLGAATGSMYRWVVRANSVYDPDQTFTGTTAIGYASLALVYTNYYVKYCTIKIKAINQTVGVPGIVMVLPSVASNVYSTLAEVKSTPYFKEITLDGLGSGGNIGTMLSTVWPHKLHNMGYKDANLIGATGGSPATQAFWLICLQAADATNTFNATIEYEIYYRTEWFGRRPMAV